MQLALPLPNHKNGHSRRERDLAADLKDWLGDLDCAKALRREHCTKSPSCAQLAGWEAKDRVVAALAETGLTADELPPTAVDRSSDMDDDIPF